MLGRIRIASAVIVALLAFAGNSLLCRFALRTNQIDPATFTSIRLLSGALTLIAIVFLKGKKMKLGGTWPASIALFGYAAGFSLAYTHLTAATGALLLFGSVQTTMIFVGWIQGERLQLAGWLGLLTACAGLAILLLPGLENPPLNSATLMILACVAWGAYTLFGRKLGKPLLATAGNFSRSIFFTTVFSLLSIPHFHANPNGVLLAGVSGAITSGLGYAIWYSILPSLTATQAAVSQLSVPILATFGGVLILGETVTTRIATSAIAILVGIGLVFSQKFPKK